MLLPLLLAVTTSAGTPAGTPQADALEARAVEHHRAARKSRALVDARAADAAYERALALPVDDARRARLSLWHADLLAELGAPRRAAARYRDVVRLARDPAVVAEARRALRSVGHQLAPAYLVQPRSNHIDIGFRRPHGARDVFCCVAPPTWSDDEALARDLWREAGDEANADLAFLLAAHGDADAVPLLRALMRGAGGWGDAILPPLALIDLLWVRGDPELGAALDDVEAWSRARDEHATGAEVDKLRALLRATPPEIARGADAASRTARWLLLLDSSHDHGLRDEVARVQADAALAQRPAVAWALARLRQPLPPRLGPDLGGVGYARLYWGARERPPKLHAALFDAGDALRGCWLRALEDDASLRRDTDVTLPVTVRLRGGVIAPLVLDGALPAPGLEPCLRGAVEGKRVDEADLEAVVHFAVTFQRERRAARGYR